MNPNARSRKLTAILRRAGILSVADRLALAGLRWLAVASAIWMGLFLLDNAAVLPNGLRLFLSLTAGAVTLCMLLIPAGRTILDRPTTARMAVRLERRYRIGRNRLINALQLDRLPSAGRTREFARRIVDDGERQAAGLPLRGMVHPAPLAWWGAAAIVALGFWTLYEIRSPLLLRNAARRFAGPLADVAPLGRALLTLHPDVDCTVIEDGPLTIVAILETGGEHPLTSAELAGLSPRIAIQPGGLAVSEQTGAERGLPMLPAGDTDLRTAGFPTGDRPPDRPFTAFQHRISRVAAPFSYRVFCPDARVSSRTVRVDVFRAPKVSASRFTVAPPSYTGLGPTAMPGPPEPLTGLADSTVRVEVTLDGKAERLFWESHTNHIEFRPVEERTATWTAETALTGAGAFSIGATIPGRAETVVLSRGGIRLRDDLPPHVEISGELHRREVLSGQNLDLDIAAEDDFGIAWLAVTARRAQGGDAVTLRRWDFGPPPGRTGSVREPVRIPLIPSAFAPGFDYLVEVVGMDFRPGGRPARSAPLPIVARAPEQASLPDVGAELAACYAAIRRAIEAQELALGASRNMLGYLDDILEFEGKDAESANSFSRLAPALLRAQADAGDRLREAIEASTHIPPPAPPMTHYLTAVEQSPARQALDTASKLGRIDPWLSGDAVLAHRGTFQDTPESQTAPFSPVTGRYAILQAHSSFGAEAVAIAELSFLDGNAQPFPSRFVQSWRMAPPAAGWRSEGGFPSVGRAEIHDLLGRALRAPMLHARRPRVDLARLAPTAATNVVAYYAAREILTDRARDVTLLAGSGGPLRVWLNGWLVMEARGAEAATSDALETALRLDPGTNRLLVEASHDGGECPLYLRFAETNGAPLGLTEAGRLRQPPDWKVVHVHRYGEKSSPRHAIDGDASTVWQGAGKTPQGLVIDLGGERTLGGLAYLAHPETVGLGIATYDLHLATALPARKNLPRRLTALIMLQQVVLDRLASILGAEMAAAAWSLGGGPPAPGTNDASAAASRADPVDLERAVKTFMDEANRFEQASKETSREREAILSGPGRDLPEHADRLDALKHEEMRHATELAAATSDPDRLRDSEPGSAAQRKALQDMLNDGGRLSELADRKAGLPSDRTTQSLDRQIGDLCRELRDAARRAGAPTEATAGGSSEAGGAAAPAGEPRTEDSRPDDMADSIDLRQQALGDKIEAIEAALTSRAIEPGRPEAGAALAMGEGSREGPLSSSEQTSSDDMSRSEMGRSSGISDGQATGADADPPSASASESGPGEGMSDSAASAKSIAGQAGAAPGGRTGLGASTDAAADFGTGPADGSSPLGEQIESAYREQRRIRETAASFLGDLQGYNLPTADFEEAIAAMSRVEASLIRTNAVDMKHAHHEASARIALARRAIRERFDRQRVPGAPRGRRDARPHAAVRPTPPEGYEEMVGAYFRKLAESNPDTGTVVGPGPERSTIDAP